MQTSRGHVASDSDRSQSSHGVAKRQLSMQQASFYQILVPRVVQAIDLVGHCHTQCGLTQARPNNSCWLSIVMASTDQLYFNAP